MEMTEKLQIMTFAAVLLFLAGVIAGIF